MLEFHAVGLRPHQQIVDFARDGPAGSVQSPDAPLNACDRFGADGHGVHTELGHSVLPLWTAEGGQLGIEGNQIVPPGVPLRSGPTAHQECRTKQCCGSSLSPPSLCAAVDHPFGSTNVHHCFGPPRWRSKNSTILLKAKRVWVRFSLSHPCPESGSVTKSTSLPSKMSRRTNVTVSL